MDSIFLDVVDVVPARDNSPLYRFLLVVALTVITEAVIMNLSRYNRFIKSLGHSVLVNGISLALGFALIEWAPGLFEVGNMRNLLVLFLITLLAETPVLYLLNRIKPPGITIRVSLLMNLLTYILFYFYIIYFAR